MPKHLAILFLITFLTGFGSGVSMYAETRVVEEFDPEEVNGTEQAGFEILVYTYGGCERVGCTSYRLLDDGTYTYLVRNLDGDARYEDSISPKRLEELVLLLRDTDFDEVSETSFMDTCPVLYDGLAYRYELRINGIAHSLDSCTQDLSGFILFDILVNYFDIFRVTHTG